MELKQTKEPETPKQQATLEAIHAETLRWVAKNTEWMETEAGGELGDAVVGERGRRWLREILAENERALEEAGLLSDEPLALDVEAKADGVTCRR